MRNANEDSFYLLSETHSISVYVIVFLTYSEHNLPNQITLTTIYFHGYAVTFFLLLRPF